MKRCFASVFNGSARLKSLENSLLKSWLHTFPSFPFLYHSLFLFRFPLLVFSLVPRQHDLRIIFHFLSFCLVVRRLYAAERSLHKRQFFPFILFDMRQFALKYLSLSLSLSLSRCYISMRDKCVKASVCLSHFYKILSFIVRAVSIERIIVVN